MDPLAGPPPAATSCRGRVGNVFGVTDLLSAGHPVVAGVLNVTPDSFFDGGRYADVDAGVAHAVRLRADGADFIDIGGGSTPPRARPGGPPAQTRRLPPGVPPVAA